MDKICCVQRYFRDKLRYDSKVVPKEKYEGEQSTRKFRKTEGVEDASPSSLVLVAEKHMCHLTENY